MTGFTIPTKMKAIVLKDYHSNLGRVLRNLSPEEIELRPLAPEEILIRMDAAPCNPSDIAFLRGMYNIVKVIPVVPGFEGTGIVVAAGGAANAKWLMKKRVSCFAQHEHNGTWAEYFITTPEQCIPVKDAMSVEQAACLAINPFTAFGLMDTARDKKATTIIQNAAGGQIGNFIRVFAGRKDINVINIVRSDEQKNILQDRGEKLVLSIRDEEFEAHLQEMAYQMNATVAFDAVGGEMTGQMLNAMPPGSQVVIYGGLGSQQAQNINVLDVIFDNKSLTGFNLGDWIRKVGSKRFTKVSSQVQDMIISGEMTTKIQASYKFEQVVRGLLQYMGHMSEGKVLFRSSQ